ncbi:MAG: hypothetical protein JNJ89_15875 [Rubrivivax sp.]|nr:hypothetical protein [Rubrivivax sp.]
MNHPAPPLPATLQRAVARVLRSLFRVLLRHGYSYTAFDETARRLYVELALAEFGIAGKKPSISRASILSGLTRKEVQRLVEEAEGASDAAGSGARMRNAPFSPEHHNRAGRVLAAWARERDFIDAQGRPRRLALQDGEASFAELVRRFSGDMPVRAVLDELERVGAARRTDTGEVEYVRPMFIARRGVADKLDLLGTDVADLITTIDHNVQHGDTDPRFQRKVMYRDMPASVVPEFRMLVAAHGMAVLQQLDVWLAARREPGASAGGPAPPPAPRASTRGKPPPASTEAAATVRLGLGIYYFEEHTSAAGGTPAQE